MSDPVPAKICVICKQDVSTLKRVKDPFGRYYCEPCYKARAAQRQAAIPLSDPDLVPTATVVPSITPPVSPPPISPPPLDLADDSNDLKLSTALTAAPVPAGNLLGCGSCKKLFPESEVLNVDGEFVCRACHAKRGKVLAYATPDNAGVPRGALLRALGSTAATIAISIAAAFVILLMTLFLLPPVNAFSSTSSGLGILGTLIAAVFYTVICLMATVVLMFSMLIAGRIVGGIEFGTFGSAVAKALGMIVLSNVINLAIPHMGDFGLVLAWGPATGIIFLLGMMILFKLDFFEGIIITVVNWMAGFAFTMLLASGIMTLTRHFSPI